MAWTQADLDRIRKAIASGTQSITFADRTQSFMGLEQLLKAEKAIAAALSTRPRQTLAVLEKGFDR